MNLTKFVFLVFICFLRQLVPAITSLLWFLLRDKKRFFYAWVAIDYAIAVDIFGEFRTLSDIAGENAHKKMRRWSTIAKFIDNVTMLFGDRPDHCKRAYEWYLSGADFK